MDVELKDTIIDANTGADAIQRAPIVDYNTGRKCLRIGDISNQRKYNEWGYTEVNEENYKKYKLEKEDILIARTGSTIGINTFIDKDYKSVYNNGLIRLRIDKSKYNSKFIYYVIQTNKFKNYINGIAFGTTGQPNMKINDLLKFKFCYIPLEIQNKIVKILDNLDKKIEFNSEINNNLHEYCKLLWKRTFSKEARKEKLEEVCIEITRGYTKNYVEKSNIINFNQKVNKGEKLEKQYFKYLSESQIIPENRFVRKNDILLNSLGQGTLGRVHLYRENYSNIVADQHITIIRTNNDIINSYYLYYLLITSEYQKELEGLVTGTTGMQMLNISSIRNLKIPIPSKFDLDFFESKVSCIQEKINSNNLENEILSQLREALLPKFMNGEITLDKIEG